MLQNFEEIEKRYNGLVVSQFADVVPFLGVIGTIKQ